MVTGKFATTYKEASTRIFIQIPKCASLAEKLQTFRHPDLQSSSSEVQGGSTAEAGPRRVLPMLGSVPLVPLVPSPSGAGV